MSVFHEPTELLEITEAECLELLGTRRVGRVGFVDGGQPLILPVNYAVDGSSIVFRTAAGTKLSAIPQTKVAFEVDDIDDATGEGWDVLVLGDAEEITDSLDSRSEQLRSLPIPSYAPGARWHRVRIAATGVSGRRIVAR
jgi:nitroimidazol reductase NimA-like FMN-containing flavoprotein (pyridoxamine 5'-phosphate oxidase superfamily)